MNTFALLTNLWSSSDMGPAVFNSHSE